MYAPPLLLQLTTADDLIPGYSCTQPGPPHPQLYLTHTQAKRATSSISRSTLSPPPPTRSCFPLSPTPFASTYCIALKDGTNALMEAARYGKPECLKLLIEAGANLNLKTNDGVGLDRA